MADAKTKERTAAEIVAAGVKEYDLRAALERKDERAGRHNAVRGLMVRLGVYPEFCEAVKAPQPAASDVPHDVVRALEIAELLREADAHIVWEANGLGNDFADRVEAALAAPAPSTSTEPSLDDWAYAFANWRQGQRSTPSCEAPGEADIRICRDLIKGMLACRPSAPSTSTEEALRAENARLRAALEVISNRPIPDQPATAPGDELSWAQRQYAQLRSIALSALSR